MNTKYLQVKKEMHDELLRILSYWQENTLDYKSGGFYGKIDFKNNIIPEAPKGIILNTRILWAFSAASNYLKTDAYYKICRRSYEYLQNHFRDQKYQGVFWEVNYLGEPINRRKQIYAQSFAIYALSEYYMFSKDESAKKWSIELFNCIEKYARDHKHDGYVEALKEDWTPIEDMRLSEKDLNAAKSMNTHLHILEAYTSLLKIYPNENLRLALKQLILIMTKKILNKNMHFDLFFDSKWNVLSYTVSFGHDIEAAWLILEAAKVVGDLTLIENIENLAIKVANTFIKEGIDIDGAVLYETNLITNNTDTDRHWWPQVEAILGLKYANSIKSNHTYIETAIKIWEYTKKHLLDFKNGEWYFRVDRLGIPYQLEDKVSMWKAPYHTTRACILINE